MGIHTDPRLTRAFLFAASLLAAGCLPAHRLNASCEWVADTVDVGQLDPDARRAHLVEDVRVAQHLGIVHGDSVAGRFWTDANLTARESCTRASMLQIERRHGIPVRDLQGLAFARVWWVDILAVLLPSALLLDIASRYVLRRAIAGYDAEDRPIAVAVVVVLVPILAAAGLVLAQIWGVSVESWRLRTDHISYRAGQIPLYEYRAIAYAVALTIVSAAAARSLRRGTRVRRDHKT